MTLDKQDCQSRQRCLSDEHSAIKVASSADNERIDSKPDGYNEVLAIPQQEVEPPQSPSASQAPREIESAVEPVEQVENRPQESLPEVVDETVQPVVVSEHVSQPVEQEIKTETATEPLPQIQEPALVKPHVDTRKKKRKRNKKGKVIVEEPPVKTETVEPEPLAVSPIDEPCVVAEENVQDLPQPEEPVLNDVEAKSENP